MKYNTIQEIKKLKELVDEWRRQNLLNQETIVQLKLDLIKTNVAIIEIQEKLNAGTK